MDDPVIDPVLEVASFGEGPRWGVINCSILPITETEVQVPFHIMVQTKKPGAVLPFNLLSVATAQGGLGQDSRTGSQCRI